MENLIKGNKDILRYVFGGNSTFTIKSVKTGKRFTYKVKKSPYRYEEGMDIPFFVKVLTSPDNELGYTFMGTVFFTNTGGFIYKRSLRSSILFNSQSNKVFTWFLNVLQKDRIPPQIEFWHCGKCCRCGRKLTVPESIASGIGPECAKHF